jgi:hypothetical protein
MSFKGSIVLLLVLHHLVWIGFKSGGIDKRLDYYGDSMVGIMSKEMFIFYTGQYYKSLDDNTKGIMPLNAFQYQADDPLSTLISASSNTTALNFKLTDICETGIDNTIDKDPQVKRVEPISTVHLIQNPG